MVALGLGWLCYLVCLFNMFSVEYGTGITYPRG
jgi:hypothetical protein